LVGEFNGLLAGCVRHGRSRRLQWLADAAEQIVRLGLKRVLAPKSKKVSAAAGATMMAEAASAMAAARRVVLDMCTLRSSSRDGDDAPATLEPRREAVVTTP